MTELRDAITYILDHAEPHGLAVECLREFMASLETHGAECQKLMKWKKPEYNVWANQALLEWDI